MSDDDDTHVIVATSTRKKYIVHEKVLVANLVEHLKSAREKAPTMKEYLSKQGAE